MGQVFGRIKAKSDRRRPNRQVVDRCIKVGSRSKSDRLQVAESPPAAIVKVDDGCGEVDLLSRLPDDVLSHVLSFLSVKEAVRAKLLSSRWRHIYPANPTLCFTTGIYCKNLDFDSFVARIDRTLQQFKAPKLAALDLSLYGELHDRKYACYVDEWIRLACSMKVERILLKFQASNEPYTFPVHLLYGGESSHLRVLNISSCSLPPFTSSNKPVISVRTLILGTYAAKDGGNFESIPSLFPNLGYLRFTLCEQVPSMQYLCDRLCHLKSLTVSLCGNRQDFEIHHANLTSFAYRGPLSNLYCKVLCFLQTIVIRIIWTEEKLECFLSGLPNIAPRLKNLSINYIYWVDFHFPSNAIFECLKSLELHISTGCKWNCDLQEVSKFLRFTPILRNLIIHLAGPTLKWPSMWLEEQLMLQQVHKHNSYAHSHLKEVQLTRIGKCFGRKDVELIISLLENATSLRRMILSTKEPKIAEAMPGIVAHYLSQSSPAEVLLEYEDILRNAVAEEKPHFNSMSENVEELRRVLSQYKPEVNFS